ncbi:glycosyltransferase [Streptomyces gobiensis]|uniref:glycosyltransferase n=1 Tax=Streptomyces gobiensis TaxID=2875706 RepID=UPI001E627C11|nr:glycosyltransferase [Streptomyces gobiensis]UGY91602.1 glycosyltransferase [Streptomyces gobiensis]
MRIAMVSEHASPLASLGGPDSGGQNVYVAQLSRALGRRGHDITVYSRRDAPDLPHRQRFADGVTVEHVPAGPPDSVPKDALFPFIPGFGAYLAHTWAGAPPDVVHAHFWMSGMAALDGARDHRIPVVQTFHALGTVKRRHQGDQDSSPAQRIATERRIGLTCAGILATCTDEVAELKAMGVPPQHAAVVPCGVDTELFRPGESSERRSARHRLLTIGRLVPRKGMEHSIRALARLPHTELLITGGPEPAHLGVDPEAQRLLRLAAEYGVAERVRLTGSVPHERMPDLIRSADVVVTTPGYEPFGIVPLEAMACGVPVVATRVGGHLDTVDDRVTGRLVEPGDVDALAATLAELLGSPELLRRYGEAGRRRVLARYTWERVADGAAQLYERLVDRPRIATEVAR